MRDTKDRRTIKVENVGAPRTNAHGGVEQDVLEVTVHYEKGGPNYFHGTTNARGYYVTVTPKTVETEKDGRAYERFALGKGFKKLLKEAARFSAKTFEEQVKVAVESTELQERLKTMTLAEGAVFAPS